jgi:regulator of replication initiation timing
MTDQETTETQHASDGVPVQAYIDQLHKQIMELTMSNAMLKAQLAALRARIAEAQLADFQNQESDNEQDAPEHS